MKSFEEIMLPITPTTEMKLKNPPTSPKKSRIPEVVL